MNVGKKARFLLVAVVLTTIIVSSVVVADDEIRFFIKITDAYYCDFDMDGIEDDVVVEFIVGMYSEDEDYPRYDMDKWFRINLEVELELPSGLSYKYELVMEAKNSFAKAKLVYFNHATESGWYYTSIHAEIIKWGLSDSDQCIFDPPEERDSTDPPTISLYY